MSGCAVRVEDAFGPTVPDDCLGGFDFTLLFEEAILTLLPLGIAVAWGLVRCLQLRDQPAKVRSSWSLTLKMILYAAQVLLHAALLAVWAARETLKTRLTLACLALTMAGYAALLVVSYLEHVRSARPSTLLSLYLSVSMLLDLARVRTLFLVAHSRAVAGLVLTSFLVKLFIFALEVSEKRGLLRAPWRNASLEETGGIYNRALFLWLNDLFRRGFRTQLTVGTLPAIDDELLAASSPVTLVERWEKADKSNRNALLWTFMVHYQWTFWAGVVPRLVYMGFSFAQPFLIQRVLDFIAEPEDHNTKNIAYGLVASYALVYFGLSLAFAVYQHKTYRLLTLFRGSLVSLIFGKTLRVYSCGIAEAEAITLMSADIDRIGSMTLVHELWASFIEAALALWLLYRLLGLAIVAPVIWILVCLVAGIPLATAAGNAQIPWLEAIEDRLNTTAKTLGAMKAIKMTGLADVVSAQVANLRKAEIRASYRHRVLNIFVFVAHFASSGLAPVWGFGLYILLARSNGGETLTQAVAFAALSVFELLHGPLGYAVDGFEHVQTVINSFRRIQDYLLSQEREDYRLLAAATTTAAPPSDSSVSQENDSDEKSLKERGPRAALLADATRVAVVQDASAGYAAEGEPTWTLRKLNFEIPRGQVVMVHGAVGCGKSTLLRLLLGELPAVSGSVSTSFARAAYCPQSPWIIWGSVRHNIVGMSAWDKPWYDTVVRACALAADLEELEQGDQTHTGIRGSRLSGGQQLRVSFARALYSRQPVMVLDDVLTGLDRTTERSILDAVFGPNGLLKRLDATVIMATNSSNHLVFADYIIALDKTGQIAEQGPPGSVSIAIGDMEALADEPQAKTSRPELELPPEALNELNEFDDVPEATRRAGDMRIYTYYARMAGWWLTAIYLFACCAFVFGVIFPSVWLQWWTNENEIHPNERLGYWLGVYGALAAVTMIGCTIADGVFNLAVLPKTARKFHELLLDTTIRATTSFLTSTNSGTTLNRFSQDLELIDNDLPGAIDSTIFQFLTAIASGVLVFIGAGYVAAAIPLCIACLVIIQFYYLRTSRQLRLLDIEAKAPLFSEFLETVNGMACVRAYGWSERYVARNRDALNASQKPFYLLWCIQRWLTLVLDLFNGGVAVLLVAVATNFRGTASAFLGVALFEIISLGSSLQTLVTQWTQVEMALGAIKRIRSFVMTVKNENLPSEGNPVPEDWPAKGTITFKDVSASYQSAQEPVLNDINFTIEAGEKVAICGRTGSGKSSLISTLLRMLDMESGAILIDGIDISTIPRQEVRGRLNTVPQEPFFLHASVRENLDPLQLSSDERIIEVLRTLHLWDFFEARDGLDGEVSEDTLSHGQRQLFCLARAIVKPGSIVVMDEATSSVDADTDELMQRILRDEFSGRTLITIAHKLHTILDYDRVVLLDKGRIIETGKPLVLLDTPSSAFRALYDSLSVAGPSGAAKH